MTEFLVYEMFRPVSAWAGVVLCRNPGVMRMAGTNSWILRAPGRTDCVVVDPGPRWRRRHLRVLAAQGEIALVLLTHHHSDHAGAATALHKLSRAPVRAWHSRECRGADPLSEGEVIESAGFRITVMYTPGHTSDSVSFVVHHGSEGAVITGDSVLGLGSTVLAPLPERCARVPGLVARSRWSGKRIHPSPGPWSGAS